MTTLREEADSMKARIRCMLPTNYHDLLDDLLTRIAEESFRAGLEKARWIIMGHPEEHLTKLELSEAIRKRGTHDK